ncbi:MAG: tRNA pseudouridine(38-40) synthase TruA [Gammaproteobacteria bacterium]|nr:tRNA pseudouridine(38-40) synthase TruA [Gammaproteobacteria bacterium]
MRIALGVEYRGSAYHGWERQRQAPTVQAELERALSKVANHRVSSTCAGRTDARVHGLGQVIHFDTDAKRRLHAWVLGTNSSLPDDVAVVWAHQVPDCFHARFSALSRCYRYLILNRRSPPAALAGQVTWTHRQLDAWRMHEAAQRLVGEHDFSAYRASGCQARTAVRRILSCSVERRGQFVVMEIEANAFLQHMVRNIAGVLMAIGTGEQGIGWAQEVLDSRTRTAGGITAPPDGLYFLKVRYPDAFALPATCSPLCLW